MVEVTDEALVQDLTRHPGSSAREVAERLGSSSQVMSKRLRGLRDKGVLRKTANARSRRTAYVVVGQEEPLAEPVKLIVELSSPDFRPDHSADRVHLLITQALMPQLTRLDVRVYRAEDADRRGTSSVVARARDLDVLDLVRAAGRGGVSKVALAEQLRVEEDLAYISLNRLKKADEVEMIRDHTRIPKWRIPDPDADAAELAEAAQETA